MSKFRSFLIAGAWGAIAVPAAQAALLFEESFEYQGGQHLPAANVNWEKVTTTAADSAHTVSTGLNYLNLVTSGGALNRTRTVGEITSQYRNVSEFTNYDWPETGASVFTSVLINIQDSTGWARNFNGEHLLFHDSSPRGGLMIMMGGTSGSPDPTSFRVRSTNTATSHWSDELPVGQTHMFVIEHMPNWDDLSAHGGTYRLWINPSSLDLASATPPTPTLTGTQGNSGTGGTRTQFAIAGTSAANAERLPASVLIDEIRVGLSWADVTPIPEPASLSLLGLAGLLMLRRRRS